MVVNWATTSFPLSDQSKDMIVWELSAHLNSTPSVTITSSSADAHTEGVASHGGWSDIGRGPGRLR
jgi:hypothetical protein